MMLMTPAHALHKKPDRLLKTAQLTAI